MSDCCDRSEPCNAVCARTWERAAYEGKALYDSVFDKWEAAEKDKEELRRKVAEKEWELLRELEKRVRDLEAQEPGGFDEHLNQLDALRGGEKGEGNDAKGI